MNREDLQNNNNDYEFLRHCEKETIKPVLGITRGTIPSWLQGELIRVGPGIQKVGNDHYTHIFDGLAVLHKFTMKDGKAWYQSRALRSDTYKKNVAANRIVVSEFGTSAHRDPCETFFGRMKSEFNAITSLITDPEAALEITDNCTVNVGYYGDQLYAMTESNFLRRVDPETLDTIGEKTNMSDYLVINAATAHPHILADGTIINMGNIYRSAKGPRYGFIKIPPSYNSDESCFANAKLFAEIPSRWKLHAAYFHSFGITDSGKLIFIEAPYCINLLGVAASVSGLMNRTISDWMKWYPNEKTIFYIVSIDSGNVHPVTYETDELFTFHHINAYEENGTVIVDVAGYSDAEWISNVTRNDKNNLQKYSKHPSARRYILPLNVSVANQGQNLILSTATSATAVLRKGSNKIVDVTPHHLTQKLAELPRINYKFNGKKYTYFYALEQQIARDSYDFGMDNVVKVNVVTGEKIGWSAANENCLASEPVFVADPTVSSHCAKEDDGVILVALMHNDRPKSVTLLILNARDMTDIGRADFVADGTVTGTLHGTWAQSGQKVHIY